METVVNEATTSEQISKVRAEMSRRDVDLLLVSPSADLLYLIGNAGHVSERPTLLAVRQQPPSIFLVPELEASNFGLPPDVGISVYGETDDPYSSLRAALGSAPNRVAISDQTQAAVLLQFQQLFPTALFEPASPIFSRLRMFKSASELNALSRAAAMADAAFARLMALEFGGRSEVELARLLTGLLEEAGLQTAGWGPIVGSGPGSASPHHVTGSRTIREGDPVLLDFGGVLDGYQADITRTVHVGEPSEDFRRVYDVVSKAQEAGVQAVGPSAIADEVDSACRSVIEDAGYGEFFVHRTGHGLGLDIHEEPYIVAENRLRLEAGMTFSIEPGVYLPDRFGVRIEDIVVVTDHGHERLNHANRELVIVE